jgi:hypothetical protein
MERAMKERRRLKQTFPLKDRLIAWAESVRKQAEKMAKRNVFARETGQPKSD